MVAFGGRAGTNPFSAECPHVVFLDGYYCPRRTLGPRPDPDRNRRGKGLGCRLLYVRPLFPHSDQG